MTHNTPPRVTILGKAAELTSGDRDKQYGEPVKNMQDIAALWSAYLEGKVSVPYDGVLLSGEDVANMCVLMKMARGFADAPVHLDNYYDGAAYVAIAGECAIAERGTKP